ncbi:peptidyl-prolyl cis-trans isomerase-like [Acrasis kona]|uniref:Peptidyl-prolyl cis-trans isomerase n=1 Tax=Acrasis kona TaxID=1008807 RepID=A0AAW2ZJI7_9EUKA
MALVLPKPTNTFQAPIQYKEVKIQTSIGEFELELYYNDAPKSCYNFGQLASTGYYNNALFHRVIKDFMVQGGDPTGTGRGGESVFGGKFEDEITPKLRHTGAGILSMANNGPGTNGSQFFVTLAPCPWLDGKYTIFGRVKSGMNVVKRLGLVPVDKNSRPLEPITILQMTSTPL